MNVLFTVDREKKKEHDRLLYGEYRKKNMNVFFTVERIPHKIQQFGN